MKQDNVTIDLYLALFAAIICGLAIGQKSYGVAVTAMLLVFILIASAVCRKLGHR